MSKKCDLTGTALQFGNKVSHSNRKTRRTFLPNIQNATFISEYIGKLSLKVTPRTISSVDIKGGIDKFLLETPSRKLAATAIGLKRRIQKFIMKEQAKKQAN